ncbi:nucleotide sugar dehydrogenase [Kitasatospora sp. NPDC048540]|uniref:nucleotide sugar dehydrogenase n=1 Tax=unclassified Kitasatospora TaxID=2633591 RepID=UPI0009EC9316|nr:nucleotide sugar dehydrogenase [Kitasatospora sp. MBT63]
MTALSSLSPGPDTAAAAPGHAPLGSAAAGPQAPTVAVVGLGYVGLPTALALVASGCRVIGLDVSTDRLDAIRRQDVDLLPTDRTRLAETLDGTGLELTADPAAIAAADTVMVCVPTPVDPHLVPDLRALAGACAAVVAHAVPGQLLMLTSTTYVGTTRELLVEPLAARGLRAGQDIHVAFSPERIDPGNAHHAQDSTPRVAGGVTERCTELAAEVLARTAPSVHRVGSAEAAEMTKLFENTFRAVNIALANEFADNCRGLGLDPLEIIEAAASKPYGFMPFYPGPGVGGHCIPCDPHYLLWQLRKLRISSPLVDTAMTAIAGRPRQVVHRVRELLAERGRPLAGARVLLCGIAYKPGVADVRESPALEILEELADLGAQVSYTDPLVPEAHLHGKVQQSVAEPAAHDWDLVVVHTVHPGADLTWLTGQQNVLDATYRLTGLPTKAVL